jgi:hypothetical protein
MQNVWALASLWVGLALVATLLAIWFKISTALTEIVVFANAWFMPRHLLPKSEREDDAKEASVVSMD